MKQDSSALGMHEHAWRLVEVGADNVSELSCSECAAVWFS
jgi:hypothetical protein